ncbi:glutathione peroxidase [Catenovulum sediminis]|uniref:Glutathione peroxidase n=1 Tax=Catenovulum sediminis TaxID=1740262 RepID=A0ABV1RNG8_9ALTE
MKFYTKSLITSCLFIFGLTSTPIWAQQCNDLLNYSATKLHTTKAIDFCQAFAGKTLLVVNTASKCGFTPQFKELEALYQKYKAQGLEVVGFPSDDFFQEHDDAEETAEVCYINYGVTFTMLNTSPVRGSDANAFYKKLISQSDTSPKWNFYKYLVSANGKVIDVYSSKTKPMNSELEKDIQSLLVQDKTAQ